MSSSERTCICEGGQSRAFCFVRVGRLFRRNLRVDVYVGFIGRCWGVGYMALVSTRRSSGQVFGWIIGAKSTSRHEDYAL